jgi:hypothetical protein
MGKPAFIYAFDNLGPERFTELCGELLGSRYKGFGLFVLGGVGPDGAIDGELDTNLGIWCPESKEVLFNDVVRSGKTVAFQFKHKVVARAGGQVQARKQLLSLYECRKNSKCELHRQLIEQKNPTDYVLVTNVEVNSNFRETFMEKCKSENPSIEHYQVIGLDELEIWISMETRLRHLYFPTIFGPPQFNLKIQLFEGAAAFFDEGTFIYSTLLYPELRSDPDLASVHSVDLFRIHILNVGTVPSYVSLIYIKAIVDGKVTHFPLEDPFNDFKSLNNPKPGTILEPGQRQIYSFPFDRLRQIKAQGNKVSPYEILVYDEIGNIYREAIPESLRNKILE